MGDGMVYRPVFHAFHQTGISTAAGLGTTRHFRWPVDLSSPLLVANLLAIGPLPSEHA